MKKNRLSTLHHAIKILKEYTKGDPEIGITELSKRTGLSKSTVNRIIQTLYEENVLYKNQQTHKYGLGLTIFEIGSVVYNELEIGQIAIPIVEKLKNQFNGDVHVSTYNRGDILYLQKIPEKVQVLTDNGGKISTHATASGKLLLAYQDQEEIDRVLKSKLVAYTNKTITSPDELRQELKRIKANGYAQSIGEYLEGISSIATPIYNDSNKVIAALSLLRKHGFPSQSIVMEVVNQLKLSSRVITENMGFNSINNSF